MSKESLDLYLNDHLAGSVAAIELLTDLVKETDPARSRFFAELREEIDEDQKTLSFIMSALEIKESPTRKAAAWLFETVAWWKLRTDGSAASDIELLQAFESLLLGITGKLALWRAIAGCQPLATRLVGVDLARLAQRATDQIARVETERIKTAALALQD